MNTNLSRFLALRDLEMYQTPAGAIAGAIEYAELERRIDACVDTLEGIKTEDLESGAFKETLAQMVSGGIQRTIEQRNELLAELKNAAIAKCEKQT